MGVSFGGDSGVASDLDSSFELRFLTCFFGFVRRTCADVAEAIFFWFFLSCRFFMTVSYACLSGDQRVSFSFGRYIAVSSFAQFWQS
jgi:hypothetical protein